MRPLYIFCLAAMSPMLLSGCSHTTDVPTPAPVAAPLSPAQAQSIQNDPKISPQMKAALAKGK